MTGSGGSGRGSPGLVASVLWRDEHHGPLPAMLIALTFVSGVVDAVSILRLGRVFVANMTGNLAFVGFAAAGVPGFSLGASLVALGGFVVGAAFAGRVLHRLAHDRAEVMRNAALLESLLLALALVVAAATAGGPVIGRVPSYSLAALLALAMGAQNALAGGVNVPDLTTSVVTRTLTGLVAEMSAGERSTTVVRRVLAVTTILAGAAIGAVVILHSGVVTAIGLALGIVASVTAAAVLASGRSGDWRAMATTR